MHGIHVHGRDEVNKSMKHIKKTIAENFIRNMKSDISDSVACDISSNFMLGLFEYSRSFCRKRVKALNEPIYRIIAPRKAPTPKPNNIRENEASLLRITVMSAALSAIIEEEKTLRKVWR